LVVLITGCSSGIGRALVAQFSKRKNLFIFASARRLEDIADLRGENVELVSLDVTDEESIRKAIELILKQKGRIDILVNNAGVSMYGPTIELNLQDCKKLFETNVFGVIACTQAVSKIMIQQQSGKIVNICSVVGIISVPFSGSYCASKAAMRAWSDTLRLELAPFGIKVLVVDPGAIKSDISRKSISKLESYETEDSFYFSVAENIRERAVSSQQNPTSAEEFASKTVGYILQSSPSSHFTYGRLSFLLPFLSRLPTWLTDKIFTRKFQLWKITAWIKGRNLRLKQQ